MKNLTPPASCRGCRCSLVDEPHAMDCPFYCHICGSVQVEPCTETVWCIVAPEDRAWAVSV